MHQPSLSSGDILKGWRLLSIRVVASLLVVLMCSGGSSAYSVLTHEEIVDLLWADEIRPLLLKRYPGLSEDQLKEAHAYAYGGAVIQDLGYYPFSNREFSNSMRRRLLSTRGASRRRIPTLTRMRGSAEYAKYM